MPTKKEDSGSRWSAMVAIATHVLPKLTRKQAVLLLGAVIVAIVVVRIIVGVKTREEKPAPASGPSSQTTTQTAGSQSQQNSIYAPGSTVILTPAPANTPSPPPTLPKSESPPPPKKTPDGEKSRDIPLNDTPAAPRLRPSFGRYHAFLVASQDYKEHMALQYAENDANVLRQVLVRRGYPVENVRSFVNARLEDYRDALGSWLDAKEQDDTVVVYLGGHGIVLDGVSYYVPVEWSGQVPRDATSTPDVNRTEKESAEKSLLSLVTVIHKLHGCRARQKLLLLDICHAGERKIAQEAGAVTSQTVERLTEAIQGAPANFATFCSCRDNELSYESAELKHGVFTYWLTRGLDGHADHRPNGNDDGLVKLQELSDYVCEGARCYGEATHMAQHPVLMGHHLESPFWLSEIGCDSGDMLPEWTAPVKNDAEPKDAVP